VFARSILINIYKKRTSVVAY